MSSYATDCQADSSGACTTVFCYHNQASDFAHVTKGILEDNGMADTVVLMHSEMEKVELPEKVNLIISEWMGRCMPMNSIC